MAPSDMSAEIPRLTFRFQLKEWSRFFADGRRMTVTITFYYQSVDAGKAGKGGAAANQQEGLEARIVDLEQGPYNAWYQAQVCTEEQKQAL